jgi:CopG family nickel-responsive transcriptional regulator
MPIVSLSVPDELVRSMKELQESQGFAGRSELVRAAIRLMMNDDREKNALSGTVSAVLVATHDEADEEPITRLKHEFEEVVKTHIHNKLSRTNCVEMFLLQGDGRKVASMANAFQKEEQLRSAKLIVIG